MRIHAILFGCLAILASARADASAVATVDSLYRAFSWEAVMASSESPGLAQQSRPILLRYFTPQLATTLAADDACSKKRHEVCALDFSPLWASQDPAAEDLQISKGTTPAQVLVRYTYPATGKTISLQYQLVHTKVGWRVADILYPSGDSLSKLLSTAKR